MVNSLYRLVNTKILSSGTVQSTIALRTSMGIIYMHGWRLTTTDVLLAPRVGTYGPLVVRVPRQMRDGIRAKLLDWRRRHETTVKVSDNDNTT